MVSHIMIEKCIALAAQSPLKLTICLNLTTAINQMLHFSLYFLVKDKSKKVFHFGREGIDGNQFFHLGDIDLLVVLSLNSLEHPLPSNGHRTFFKNNRKRHLKASSVEI